MENVKRRIKQARVNAGLTQTDVAKACGLTRQAVGNWENLDKKDAPDLKALHDIAAKCGVKITWLVDGLSDNVEIVTNNIHKVPLLEWTDIGESEIDMRKFANGYAGGTYTCPVECAPMTFALKVKTNAMTSDNPLEASYPKGCIIFCDPSKAQEATSGSLVIAYLEESREIAFKMYIKDGGKEWLESLNSKYDRITEPFVIRAQVLGSFNYA